MRKKLANGFCERQCVNESRIQFWTNFLMKEFIVNKNKNKTLFQRTNRSQVNEIVYYVCTVFLIRQANCKNGQKKMDENKKLSSKSLDQKFCRRISLGIHLFVLSFQFVLYFCFGSSFCIPSFGLLNAWRMHKSWCLHFKFCDYSFCGFGRMQSILILWMNGKRASRIQCI